MTTPQGSVGATPPAHESKNLKMAAAQESVPQNPVGAGAQEDAPSISGGTGLPAHKPRGLSRDVITTQTTKNSVRATAPMRAPRIPPSRRMPVAPTRNVNPRANARGADPMAQFREYAARDRMPRCLGQVENVSIHRVMTLLALMLTGATRIYGSQAYDCNNAGDHWSSTRCWSQNPVPTCSSSTN
jgi:hypothetical protein